jgi:hypothetical protein
MATTKNTDTAADEIPRGFNLIAAHLVNIKVVLESISDQMEERNNLLRGAGEDSAPRIAAHAHGMGQANAAGLEERIARLEGAMSSIPGKMDDLTVLVKSIAAMVKPPQVNGAGRTIEPPNGEAKAIAGRIIEHTVAQAQAQAGLIPGGVVEAAPQKRGRGRPPKVENCKHGTIEDLSNGLVRCLRCGATLDLKTEKMAAGSPEPVAVVETKPVEVAAQVAAVKEKLAERIAADERSFKAHVEANITPIAAEKKPAPKESVYKSIDGKLVEVDPDTLEPFEKVIAAMEKKVEARIVEEEKVEAQPEPVKATLDDVRAVAIGYAGKHGKEKLGAVLVKYGAGNLSSVPAEKYDALMAELQAS